jgi:hypothetical protein
MNNAASLVKGTTMVVRLASVNFNVALLSQLKELNNLCQPINNQRSSRKSQPKSIDSKKEHNKNHWWQ